MGNENVDNRPSRPAGSNMKENLTQTSPKIHHTLSNTVKITLLQAMTILVRIKYNPKAPSQSDGGASERGKLGKICPNETWLNRWWHLRTVEQHTACLSLGVPEAKCRPSINASGLTVRGGGVRRQACALEKGVRSSQLPGVTGAWPREGF